MERCWRRGKRIIPSTPNACSELAVFLGVEGERMTLKWRALLIVAALLGAMQFASPKPLNPVSQDRDALEADQDVPAGIAKLLERSCMDCHSNHTHWTWYSHVAPVSWYIHHHIEEGRRKMNF